jgi:glycine/D-amino acid oxidase-like deaminating enzyme
MATSKIGKQAGVIGAGMAGLAAAGAIADYFEQVIVLERDRLPDQAVPRLGALQSRHLHGLLPGGQRALTDLFPHSSEIWWMPVRCRFEWQVKFVSRFRVSVRSHSAISAGSSTARPAR